MRRRLLEWTCVVLLVSCGTAEKDVQNDTAKAATIEGVVRELGTETPIAGVSVFPVRLSNDAQLRATTDADGRFLLEGLNAGRHLVAVVREGYVVPGRLEISGYPFTLTAGQRIENAVFHMIPAGTISGRVFSPDGKPANRIEVQLLQNLYLMGRLQWSSVNRGGSARNARVFTNERGEFRALGVDPGEYVIRFVPEFVPGSSSTASALYPGVRDISKAAPVRVQPGRESLLDDITLKSERRGWIRVLVMNESGESLESFGAWSIAPPGWIGSDYVLSDEQIVGNIHAFQPDVPGTYDIVAAWSTPGGQLAGKVRVHYNGRNVDVKLPVRKPTGKLTGRVVIQEQGSHRPLTGVEVAIGPDISYFGRSGPDGTLSVPNVYAGRYQLGYVRGLPEDAFVLSVRQGSRDVFQEGVAITGRDDADLEIVVSGGAGILKGKVLDETGRAAHNALVVLVPDPPLKDRKDYYGAFKDIRTDQNGEFEIRGITPGSYHAYAWTDAPASAYRNDAFMKAYAGKGVRVQLDVNARASVELKAL
jgi:hypothetical protein